MTPYDYLACIALISAIVVNCLSVHAQKEHKFYDRFNHGYWYHTALVSIAWGAFIITEFIANKSTWRLSSTYPTAGLIIMAGAVLLFIAAIKEIGTNALSNGNFFGYPIRNLSGIYRYIKEPIYWSYAVWFAGLGLLTGMKVFFVYVALAIVGLVLIESRVERVN